MRFQGILNVINKIESNIRVPVLLNLLNSLRKRDKMLGKPRILSLFRLINSIKHEHSCKILHIVLQQYMGQPLE